VSPYASPGESAQGASAPAANVITEGTAGASQASAANQRPLAVHVSSRISPALRATSPIWSAPT